MKITFTATNDFAQNILEIPKPSKSFIPQWYKDAPRFIDEKYNKPEIPDEGGDTNNVTFKSCAPLLDALTYGYTVSLPLDVQLRNRNGSYLFNWRTEQAFVTSHSGNQHVGLPTPLDHQGFVMKWSFDFIIKTPPGWSTFFTHPLNRMDLPFTTFSGIVDTDKYNSPVQFPFQVKSIPENNSIIIERGTPICQLFPIKRESWTSEKKNFDPIQFQKDSFNFKGKIINSYKKFFWQKKFFN